jgi:hypothetical protein
MGRPDDLFGSLKAEHGTGRNIGKDAGVVSANNEDAFIRAAKT